MLLPPLCLVGLVVVEVLFGHVISDKTMQKSSERLASIGVPRVSSAVQPSAMEEAADTAAVDTTTEAAEAAAEQPSAMEEAADTAAVDTTTEAAAEQPSTMEEAAGTAVVDTTTEAAADMVTEPTVESFTELTTAAVNSPTAAGTSTHDTSTHHTATQPP